MVRLRDELDREREERNFFQLERDKVNGYWDISKRQLEEARSTVRNKERELEDAEERHQVEIKVRGVSYMYVIACIYDQKSVKIDISLGSYNKCKGDFNIEYACTSLLPRPLSVLCENWEWSGNKT